MKTADQKPDQIVLGVTIILLSVTAMAFGDAIVKLMSAHLTLWQVFVARSLFALPCLFALGLVLGVRFSRIWSRWIVLRSVLLVLTWIGFYSSLPVLKLSVAAVAVYTNPIITALITAKVLGEPVSRRQWFGVLLGFGGVVAILRPGTEGVTWLVVLPLAAACLYSTAMVLTRAKCKQDHAINLALGLHSAFITIGLFVMTILMLLDITPEMMADNPFLLKTWSAMSSADWALMALLGAMSAVFFIGVARAYQVAPPQIIGTFDYAYLISAAIWGFVFFAEKPDAQTVLGMVLITLAGVLVAKRRS